MSLIPSPTPWIQQHLKSHNVFHGRPTREYTVKWRGQLTVIHLTKDMTRLFRDVVNPTKQECDMFDFLYPDYPRVCRYRLDREQWENIAMVDRQKKELEESIALKKDEWKRMIEILNAGIKTGDGGIRGFLGIQT